MLNGLSIYCFLISPCIAILSLQSAFAGSMGENNRIFNKLEIYGSGGPFFSTLRNDTSVAINSFVVNDYITNQQTKWQGLAGGGIDYSFGTIFNTSVSLSLGMAGYTIYLGSVQGIEYPFVNDGIYDTLNYQFSATSSALMVESRWFYTNYAWQPFALVGIGAAWNQLSNYNETPTDPSLSAAPVSPEFSNQTNSAFTYELGGGLQHQIYEDVTHMIRYIGSIDYRYVDFGKGQLASFPAQTTGEALQIGNMSTQGIMFSLKISSS